ncbi:MAG: hypothetical protein H7175_00330 [Burkholderiales bacterium]|nr:hypothetical protein [Anaerolineae bacterium]
MADQILRPDLIERLQALARRKNRDVNELVEDYLETVADVEAFDEEASNAASASNPLLTMVEFAQKANLKFTDNCDYLKLLP